MMVKMGNSETCQKMVNGQYLLMRARIAVDESRDLVAHSQRLVSKALDQVQRGNTTDPLEWIEREEKIRLFVDDIDGYRFASRRFR